MKARRFALRVARQRFAGFVATSSAVDDARRQDRRAGFRQDGGRTGSFVPDGLMTIVFPVTMAGAMRERSTASQSDG